MTILGGRPANSMSDVIRCIVTRSGLFEISPNTGTGFLNVLPQLPIQHHPITYPTDVNFTQPAGQHYKVSSGAARREGDSIMLKGLGLKGYLCLGKDCANARVHVGMFKSENNIADPQALLPELDGFQLRREIDTTEKLNGTKVGKTYTLNHRSSATEVKIPVNLYLPLNKRIKYGKNQPDVDEALMSQIWYEDLRYYIVMYSDVKDEVLTGGIPGTVPNADLLSVYNKFPTFYGRWVAYYRDA